MKIIILYSHNKGLLSNFFQELSEKLYEEGCEVLNFCLKHNKKSFIQNGVSVCIDKNEGYFNNYYKIFKLIKKEKPNVVISNFSYINPAVLAGRLLGVEHNIAWFHSAYGHTKPSVIKVLNKTLYLNMAQIVLANSRQLQNEMHTVYKVPRERTNSIPFWTNINNYEPCSKTLSRLDKENVFKIGCPGRLVSDKNHQTVIEAVNKLKAENKTSIQLYLAGDGAYKESLKLLVNQLDMNDSVVFLGDLSVTEMIAFYKSMNVVVLPSFNEAFGLVFIEAIALGSPVIVSSKFGALDFIDQKQFPLKNFTFDPNSVTDLICSLQNYLENRGVQSDYFNHLYTSTFNKDVIFKKILKIIKKV
ncbi:glycosyltransferase family 4 protein [Winogradskyella costae]|uniref:glycosyltransferase family 4 protein n=1 Tax=Winogradskyella costae TaxID=2697008 RepID=UPI0015C9B734|nr:glycosyltransferase family 4 protein [Winogradskyella costae]